jgi:radial spoke head protein 4A
VECRRNPCAEVDGGVLFCGVVWYAQVRFFGKFFGINSDYYVFEATLQEEGEAPEEGDPTVMPAEEPGTGANAYTYFVCSQLGGPCTKLPPVSPSQIKVAQQIKKFFSGDLTAEVSAFPPFPGNEANYLRATIARIAATTVVCPAGYFAVGEDEVTLEKEEEWAPLEGSEMMLLENWCHRYPHIKPQGRCAFWAPPPPEDEEALESYEEPTPEESPALLSTLAEDAEVLGGPAWSAVTSSAIPSVQFQVTGVRSNLWPGAVAVMAKGAFTNVYIGWGLKNEKLLPAPPPAVMGEWSAPLDDEGNPTFLLQESTELPPPPQAEGEGEEEDE